MIARVPRLPFNLHPLMAEARRRARQRRLLMAVAVVALAGGAAGAAVAISGQSRSASQGSAPPGPAVALAGCRNCGEEAVWLNPHLLLFEQGNPYHGNGVMSVDHPSGKEKLVARFLSFVVSPNERWLAGELRPKGALPLVAVISLRDHSCRVVARASGPNENLVVAGIQFLGGANFPPGGSGIQWRRSGRVSVAVGPGVGFTRDSRGLIVAVDRWSNQTGAYHRRLVQYPLSSLRTRCPTVVTARSAGAMGLGPWPYPKFRRSAGDPLTVNLSRHGHQISSITVTANSTTRDATMRLLVLRGSPYGKPGRAPNHPAVFTERVQMNNLPSPGDVPPGSFPRATWTGTLSPSDWRGGCQKKLYEVFLQIGPAHTSPSAEGERLGSPWFHCKSG